MEIILDWPPRALSPNARGHWAVKATAGKAYLKACWGRAKMAKAAVAWDGPIHLWVTFHPPSRRRVDMDNCIAAMKHGMDGLAFALGVDDARFRWHPFMSPDPKKGGAVVVRISRDA